MNQLLSIIMPLYNAELYVEEAIESVLSEGYEPKELIIVNDGSTDNSRLKISRFESDSRVTIIDKENGGAADSRNVGIGVARGEFITFFDSDDFIEKGSYVNAISLLRSDDRLNIVQFPILFEWCSSKERIRGREAINLCPIFDATYIYELFTQETITLSTCDKVYRRSFLGDYRFTPGMVMEDGEFNARLMMDCRAFIMTDKGLYRYRATPNSVMKSAVTKKFIDNWIVAKRTIILNAIQKGISQNVIACALATYYRNIEKMSRHLSSSEIADIYDSGYIKISIPTITSLYLFLRGKISLRKFMTLLRVCSR